MKGVLHCPRCGEHMTFKEVGFWQCTNCAGEWWPRRVRGQRKEDTGFYLGQEKELVCPTSKKKGGLTKRVEAIYTYIGSVSLNRFSIESPRTAAETTLMKALIGAGFNPLPQYTFQVRGKKIVVDFAFLPEQVAVECDGRHHDFTRQRHRDEERDKLLWRYGWRVIRLKDKQIMSNSSACVDIIRQELQAQH